MNARIFSLLTASIAVLFLAGCASAPQPAVKYVDPTAQGPLAGTGIESQDIGAAAQQAAQSIVNLPQIAAAQQPPIILITPVVNRSTAPVDTDLYTVKLRGVLMQHGAGKVRFLAREEGTEVNLREQELRASGEVVSGNQQRAAGTYDYILTAEVRGLSVASNKGQSEYFLVAFKLVDFNDMLLWENQYEFKKAGRVNRVYR